MIRNIYKNLLFFILLILINGSVYNIAFGQELTKSKNYTYTDTSGNFYIQRSQPIYLWIGFSENNKDQTHLLKSDATATYTNPFYFDNEGLNIIRSPWAVDRTTHEKVYPLQVIEFEVYADGIAPKTKIHYDHAGLKKISSKNYFGNELSMNLIATDATSGVNQIYYSIDSQPYQIYTEAIAFTDENEHLLQYYAIDNVGNLEKVNKLHFILDITKPETNLTIDTDQYNNVISQRSKISLEAKDNISGIKNIKVNIDDGPESIYKGALYASFLKQGEHTLNYYATDNVGNKEEVKSFTFFVDNTPPILVEEVLGNSFMNNGKEYSSGRSKLKLTAVDNKAGIKTIYYSLNGGEYLTYKKPFYLSIISGSLNITSYAVDNVNNKSVATRNTTKKSITYIDLTGPEIQHRYKGPVFKVIDSVYINKKTLIILDAIDNESGFKSLDYNVDSKEMKTYSEPFKIEKAGLHHISTTAFDNVNNSNINEFSVVVDNEGPEIFYRFSILPIGVKNNDSTAIQIYSSQVSLFLSVTDSRVAIDKIYYQINDQPEKLYLSYIGGFKQGVDYKIKVRATDKLDNESFTNIIFATDNTGPEIYTQFSAPVKSQKEIDGKNVNVYPAYVSLFLSVTNAHIAYEKIFYSINGNAEKPYTGVIENFSAHTDINMNLRAIDQLGNQTKKEILFSIE